MIFLAGNSFCMCWPILVYDLIRRGDFYMAVGTLYWGSLPAFRLICFHINVNQFHLWHS